MAGTEGRTEITENGEQFLFDFDFFDEEEQAAKEKRCRAIEKLKHFAEPETDNERLFNLQYDYYHGDKTALQTMFLVLHGIAKKLVNKECTEHKIRFTEDHKDEVGLDATTLVIEQFIKNELIIQTSFISYVYLQVRKVMYNRTQGQRIEAYCKKNNISLFDLTDEEKKIVKGDFEWELLHPQKSEEHSLSV